MLRRVIKWCYKFGVSSWDIEFSVKFKRHKIGRHVMRGALTAIPLALLSYGLVNYVNVPPHQFSDTECYGCHFTIPMEGDQRPYQFIKPVNEQCLGCHDKLDIMSHAEGVVPTFPVPPGLPLDGSGRLTCATCHDPHAPPADPETGRNTYMLRGGPGKAMCRQCHATDLSALLAVTHRPVMTRAHGFTDYTQLEPGASLDRLSVECIGCHDDPHGPEITNPGSAGWKHDEDLGVSHRIGVDYAEAERKNRDLSLRDVRTLDQGVVLFGGRLACCTCHDPYKPGGGVQLRIGERNGFQDLCEACHLY